MIYRSNSPPVRSPPWCELYRVHEVQKKLAWDINKIRDFFDNQANQFSPDMVKLLFSNIEKIISLY